MPTIVLFQPQIPQNTGNIVRTCHVTGANLLLVPPLGFSISNRHLKRAGLDYWEGVDVKICDDLTAALEERAQDPTKQFTLFSSKATCTYSSITYLEDDWLIFGSETSGLPGMLTERWPEHCAKIPMRPGVRCLNLATSVGIALYELQRQLGFPCAS